MIATSQNIAPLRATKRNKLTVPVDGVAAYAKGLKLGHGLSPDTQMGQMVSLR